jgi:type I restriction enzyme R subunit
MHALRILGNEAVHQSRPIHQTKAVAMIRDLFSISHWFARTYTQGDPNSVPHQFDEAQLPPAPRDIVLQNRAQLKQIGAALLHRDAELRQERETVAALQA